MIKMGRELQNVKLLNFVKFNRISLFLLNLTELLSNLLNLTEVHLNKAIFIVKILYLYTIKSF